MQINNKDYKYKFRLKDIFSDFIKISDFFINNLGVNWWFFNSSRLDLRQAGDINLNDNNINENDKIFNYKERFKNQLIIFKFFFNNLFVKKTKLEKNKNYLFIEQIYLQNKNSNLIDYYFKDIFKGNEIDLISIGLEGNKNRLNEIEIIKLCNFIDIIIIYIESLLVNRRYINTKAKINNLGLSTNNFWGYYFQKKESSNNFKRLFLSKLVLRLLKKKQDYNLNIFYPYEEKPFERALNFAFGNSSNNSLFAYYGNPQDHHSFFLRRFQKLNIPRPNNFLCAGIYQKDQLIKYNSKKKIKVIGSYKSEKEIKKMIKYDFLVFISHEIELETFTKWIKSNEKNYIDLKFLVRMYSQLKNIEQNENYIYLQKKKNFCFSNQNFENDISICKFTIFSRTSAGPQAVNYGCLSIWADFSLTGSNALFGQVKNFFPSFNKDSFNTNILKLSEMSKTEEDEFLKIQKKISEKIFSKIDYKLINDLIKMK